MKWITTYCLICIFHCVGFSTNPILEDKYYLKGDSLFQQGEFEKAALVYERAAFETIDNDDKTIALIQKAKCLWKLERYKDASGVLDRIPLYTISDSLSFETQFASATTSYLAKDFIYAKSQLIQIESFVMDTQLINKTLFLHVLTLNELEEWEAAKAKAQQWIQSTNVTDSIKRAVLIKIDSLYSEEGLPKLKNVEKAGTLSSIIPGSGQMYAGYFFEGAANVSLQLLGLGIVVGGILTQYYVAGFVVGLNIYQRFYMGGVKRAEFLARKTNYLRKQDFSQATKSLIPMNPK